MKIKTTTDFERIYVRPREGRTLVVGSRLYAAREDRRARYHNAIGVDMIAGSGVDRVINLEESLPEDIGKFDHIDCVSVLEHARSPWLLAVNLQHLLMPEGTIFVEAPFVWRVHAYPSDFWRFTDEALRVLFPAIHWHKLQFVPEVNSLRQNEGVYFSRTEVCGFGKLP